MRYAWLRVRSWWFWRRFGKPGRTIDRQAAFARRHLDQGGQRSVWP